MIPQLAKTSLTSPRLRGIQFALGGMLTIQTGVALTLPLVNHLGAPGAAWIRLCFAGAFFLAFIRIRRSHWTKQSVALACALGVMTGGMTLCFLAAIQSISMGTASALEFLGPLGVAVFRGAGKSRFIWSCLAAIGVAALTEPWQGQTDLTGAFFALAAGGFWAGYILLTERTARILAGMQSLAVSMPVAALAASTVGWQAIPDITVVDLVHAAVLALIATVIPYGLELAALRRVPAATFGILMSLEPAIAAVVGAIGLQQVMAPTQLLGLGAVVAAGLGAERTGRTTPRDKPADVLPDPVLQCEG